MRLIDWQLAFEQHLMAEDSGVNQDLRTSLIGGPSLDVDAGLAIYHNAYRARLLEVMQGDFPAVWHWLGDEEFIALVQAYVRVYPSGHFSLRWLGQRFAGFIAEHLIAQQSAPLVELARLEWAFTLAFDAPPGQPLTLADMAALAPEAWPGLQVQWVPSVQSLCCRFNSLAIWRSVKDQTDFPGSQLLALAQACLVWRDQQVCRYRSLEPAEAYALAGMVDSAWTFSELCAELAVTYQEGASLQAATWLKQWVQDGLLQRRAS
ncbi:DNA-binding domain-containing protein [Pseudomonas sp. 15FMM2]|uniref:DNA-binding domain-containing protein n=1 Tax=Pseudomonas imrae TaxID=2992837 RepID=A0ACC7PEZ6_9PSED